MYFMSIKYTALHTVVAILYHVNQRVDVIYTYCYLDIVWLLYRIIFFKCIISLPNCKNISIYNEASNNVQHLIGSVCSLCNGVWY